MFDTMVQSLLGLLAEFKPFIMVCAVGSLMVAGICFQFGGKFREEAKERLPFVLVGIFLTLGAASIVQAIYNSLAF